MENNMQEMCIGKRDVLKEITSEKLTERQKKAMIFGAIFGLAEYACKGDVKLLELYTEYCSTPGKILDKVLLKVNCERRAPRIERRLDALVWQLSPEDLEITLEFNEEQGCLSLGRHWERSFLRGGKSQEL